MVRPRLPHRVKVLLVASAAVFIAFLDVTIVNVAFPSIKASYPGTTTADLSWVLNAYNVVIAALLVPAGRLADRLGRRRIFFLGVAVFLVASVLCAAAPSAWALVAARCIQALGAAMLVPSSLALVLPEFAPERRAMAASAWAASGAVAAALGPSLGGLLVESAGWRWAFLLNLVVGLGILPARRVLRERREPDGGFPDLLGSAALTLGVGTLALGIVKAPDRGWASSSTIGCLLVAAGLIGALVRRSRHHRSPVLEPALFQVRSFAAANACALLFSMAVYALLLGNVLFLTTVWGYSVLAAGFAVSPGPLVAALAAGPAGRLSERMGPRVVAVSAALLFAFACLAYREAGGSDPNYLAAWLPAALLSGVAIGAGFAVISSAPVRELPAERLATGTAVVTCFRQIGAVLGIAALVAVIGTPAPADALAAFDRAWLLEALAAGAAAVAALAFESRKRQHTAVQGLAPRLST